LLLKHLLPPGIDKEIVNATQDQYESLKETQDLRKLLEELNTFEAVKVMRKRDVPEAYRKGLDGSRSTSEAGLTGGQRSRAAGGKHDLRSSKDTMASQKQKN
jgi:hypothetical protein